MFGLLDPLEVTPCEYHSTWRQPIYWGCFCRSPKTLNVIPMFLFVHLHRFYWSASVHIDNFCSPFRVIFRAYPLFGGALIRHFRVPPGLCFKTRVGAQPLIWKSFFILMQIKLIFTRKVVHLASFWKWCLPPCVVLSVHTYYKKIYSAKRSNRE